MSAHTPGPWAIDPERPDYHGRKLGFYVHAPAGGGGRIGQVFENCLVTSAREAQLNAAAFAAAPAMLALLEQLEEAWNSGDQDTDAMFDSMAQVRVLIREGARPRHRRAARESRSPTGPGR